MKDTISIWFKGLEFKVIKYFADLAGDRGYSIMTNVMIYGKEDMSQPVKMKGPVVSCKGNTILHSGNSSN